MTSGRGHCRWHRPASAWRCLTGAGRCRALRSAVSAHGRGLDPNQRIRCLRPPLSPLWTRVRPSRNAGIEPRKNTLANGKAATTDRVAAGHHAEKRASNRDQALRCDIGARRREGLRQILGKGFADEIWQGDTGHGGKWSSSGTIIRRRRLRKHERAPAGARSRGEGNSPEDEGARTPPAQHHRATRPCHTVARACGLLHFRFRFPAPGSLRRWLPGASPAAPARGCRWYERCTRLDLARVEPAFEVFIRLAQPPRLGRRWRCSCNLARASLSRSSRLPPAPLAAFLPLLRFRTALRFPQAASRCRRRSAGRSGAISCGPSSRFFGILGRFLLGPAVGARVRWCRPVSVRRPASSG